jgi:hypothetical protein
MIFISPNNPLKSRIQYNTQHRSLEMTIKQLLVIIFESLNNNHDNTCHCTVLVPSILSSIVSSIVSSILATRKMKSLTYNIIVSVAVILSLTRTCRALAPPMSTTTRTCTSDRESFGSSCSGGVTRRAAALSLISSVLATGVITPGLVFAATDDNNNDAEAAAAAAKERMRQRIADSKKNYRKSTDLVQQRKDTTDYSCVSETGSPCPEGLVPRAVQREIIGALEKK